MTIKKTYDTWTKWHGGECPVPLDTMVVVLLRNGRQRKPVAAGAYDWQHRDDGCDIVEYHTITKQTDLEAAEKLLRANGYKITPPTRPLTFDDVVPMTEAPPEGTLYWVISLSATEGVIARYWTSSCDAGVLIKRRMAYLKKEHALIAARHIFGLKGGEL